MKQSKRLHFTLINPVLYLFPGGDRRGSRSCRPSRRRPCNSTPASLCCATRRCRRSLHHSSCSSTPSSPRLRKWTEGRAWCLLQLFMDKESISLRPERRSDEQNRTEHVYLGGTWWLRSTNYHWQRIFYSKLLRWVGRTVRTYHQTFSQTGH